MLDSSEYRIKGRPLGAIAFVIVAIVFGAVVYACAYMVELIHPGDEDIWIIRVIAYGIISVGLLMLLFRRRILLDGKHRLYVREWGFGLMFCRKHIPFYEFSYVLLEAIRPNMRTVYQVNLARRQNKIRKSDRTDIGDEATQKIAQKVEGRDMVGVATAAIDAATSSHQPSGFVLYGICADSDIGVCRDEAEQIAQLLGVPIHERIGDGNTTIRSPGE